MRRVSFVDMVELKELNLNQNSLTKFDQSWFENLSKLVNEVDINGNRLSNEFLNNASGLGLEKNTLVNSNGDIFQGLRNLRQLVLADNKIGSIEAKSFLPLTNLLKLDLSRNTLTEINAGMFQGLHKLQTLDVSQNKISVIQPKSFDELEKLKKLNLENNSLSKFDQSVLANLRELKEFNLNGNRLPDQYTIRIFC